MRRYVALQERVKAAEEYLAEHPNSKRAKERYEKATQRLAEFEKTVLEASTIGDEIHMRRIAALEEQIARSDNEEEIIDLTNELSQEKWTLENNINTRRAKERAIARKGTWTLNLGDGERYEFSAYRAQTALTNLAALATGTHLWDMNNGSARAELESDKTGLGQYVLEGGEISRDAFIAQAKAAKARERAIKEQLKKGVSTLDGKDLRQECIQAHKQANMWAAYASAANFAADDHMFDALVDTAGLGQTHTLELLNKDGKKVEYATFSRGVDRRPRDFPSNLEPLDTVERDKKRLNGHIRFVNRAGYVHTAGHYFINGAKGKDGRYYIVETMEMGHLYGQGENATRDTFNDIAGGTDRGKVRRSIVSDKSYATKKELENAMRDRECNILECDAGAPNFSAKDNLCATTTRGSHASFVQAVRKGKAQNVLGRDAIERPARHAVTAKEVPQTDRRGDKIVENVRPAVNFKKFGKVDSSMLTTPYDREKAREEEKKKSENKKKAA